MPETSAVEACFRDRYPDLVRFLHGMLGDRMSAEDAAQEAFRRLLTRGPQNRPDADRWVFSAARRIALDLLKTDRHRQAREALHAEAPEQPEPEDPDAAQVRAIVAQLPTRSREVLILQAVYGLSLKEIAGVVERSVGAVKQDLHRARLALRNAWFQQQETDA
jgi:RNA polymerase sigma-70 factor (ECF subfamily)